MVEAFGRQHAEALADAGRAQQAELDRLRRRREQVVAELTPYQATVVSQHVSQSLVRISAGTRRGQSRPIPRPCSEIIKEGVLGTRERGEFGSRQSPLLSDAVVVDALGDVSELVQPSDAEPTMFNTMRRSTPSSAAARPIGPGVGAPQGR
jgi:hypothetical protein